MAIVVGMGIEPRSSDLATSGLPEPLMFALILSSTQMADALSYVGSRLEKWEEEFRAALGRSGNAAPSISPPLLRGSTIFVPKAAVPEAHASLLALLNCIQSRCNHRDALHAERALLPLLRQITAHAATPGPPTAVGVADGSQSRLEGRLEGNGAPGAALEPLAIEPGDVKAALAVLGSDLHLWRNAIRAGTKPGPRDGHRYDASIDGPLLHDGAILVGRRHMSWMLDALRDLEPTADAPSLGRVVAALEPVRRAIRRMNSTP